MYFVVVIVIAKELNLDDKLKLHATKDSTNENGNSDILNNNNTNLHQDKMSIVNNNDLPDLEYDEEINSLVADGKYKYYFVVEKSNNCFATTVCFIYPSLCVDRSLMSGN